MQSSLLTSWGLRDYGTATWEGGEEGCDHRHETAHQKQGATSARVGRANVEDQRNENFRDVCGKCGARRIDNQIGLEETPELHIEALLEVFREVWRVLRKDGTLWCNYGDCYACAPNGRKAADIEGDDRTFRDKPFSTATNGRRNTQGGAQTAGEVRFKSINLKPKDLVGMPWRLALALQDDGWWLRSDIIWSKPNPMPSSVTDRPTTSHEYLFLLAKSERYFMDMDAIREPHTLEQRLKGREPNFAPHQWIPNGDSFGNHNRAGGDGVGFHPAGRNRRTVWTIATQPTPEAHFATFPEALVEPCILAGTSERGVCPTCGAPWERVTEKQDVGGWHNHEDDLILGNRSESNERKGENFYKNWKAPQTTGWAPTCAHSHTEAELLPALVLDCFAGSGTVSRVASRLGRRSIGIELSEEYVTKIARKRNNQGSLGL